MKSRRISALGKAIADPNRAEILCVLSSGRSRTAGQLAAHVGLAASTTSHHLSELVAAGLVAAESQGRHRYFRLRSQQTSDLLNAIEMMDLPESSLAPNRSSAEIVLARTCYDHLAGELGVGLYEAMLGGGLLEVEDDIPRLTAAGHATFRRLDVDTELLAAQRRPLVRSCVDWDQQSNHLGGAAAADLLVVMFDRGWLERQRTRRTSRAVTPTPHGLQQLKQHFGLIVGTGGTAV